jgi:hypothetical protein
MKIRLSQLRRIIAEEVEAALDEASVAPESLKSSIRQELGGEAHPTVVNSLASKLNTLSKMGLTRSAALEKISKDKDLPFSPGPDREKALKRLVSLLDLPERPSIKR